MAWWLQFMSSMLTHLLLCTPVWLHTTVFLNCLYYTIKKAVTSVSQHKVCLCLLAVHCLLGVCLVSTAWLSAGCNGGGNQVPCPSPLWGACWDPGIGRCPLAHHSGQERATWPGSGQQEQEVEAVSLGPGETPHSPLEFSSVWWPLLWGFPFLIYI